MKPWMYFVIAVFVVMVLLIIYYFIKKKKNGRIQEQDFTSEQDLTPDQNRIPAQDLTPDQNLTPEDEEIIRVLAEGISHHKTEFTGLYELMYQISRENTRNASGTFGEWCLRVENFEEDSAFSRLFSGRFSGMESGEAKEQIQNAKLIIQGIFESGIKREEAQSLQADKRTVFSYVTLDDTAVVPGQLYEIYRPCWSEGALILEKGILRFPQQDGNDMDCSKE